MTWNKFFILSQEERKKRNKTDKFFAYCEIVFYDIEFIFDIYKYLKTSYPLLYR